MSATLDPTTAPPTGAVQSQQGVDLRAKIVVLGESAVGKSSLTIRFVRRQFVANQETTIGAAFLTKSVTTRDGGTLRMEMWDTAGQERYRSLAPMYYRGAAGALIVYDITSTETLMEAQRWLKELRTQSGSTSPIVIVLVGNKLDLAEYRQVTEDEGRRVATEEGALWFEISAKDGTNLDEMFKALGSKIRADGLGVPVAGAGRKGALPPGALTAPPTNSSKPCEKC